MKFNEFLNEGNTLDKKQNKDILNDVNKALDILQKVNKKLTDYAGFDYSFNPLTSVTMELEKVQERIKKEGI